MTAPGIGPSSPGPSGSQVVQFQGSMIYFSSISNLTIQLSSK